MATLIAPTISVRPISLAAPDRGTDLLVHLTAPGAGADLPVIVFSHGYGAFGASMDTYRPLVDHWVDQGFVVVQPNHLDAQGLAADDPRSAVLWAIRIRDLRQVVDRLGTVLAAIPGLPERTDVGRLAVAGHSYGATTASALVGARVVGAGGTDLPTLIGAEHSLGGINAYNDTHTTDEDPDRVALVRRASTAYLRSALGIEQESWAQVRNDATELGRFESKQGPHRAPTRRST